MDLLGRIYARFIKNNYKKENNMIKKSMCLAVGILSVTSVLAGTLDDIRKKGSISFGVRESSGLGFSLGNGKYVGFHTEMGERIIADIKQQLELDKLEIKYQPVTSQNRMPLLNNGTVDLECGSTTNNTARQKEVDFAMTTYVEEVRIAVKKKSGIKNIADLEGKTIAVSTGTTSVQHLRRHQKGTKLNVKTIMGKDHAESFLLLEGDKADAFIMDASILAANISRSKNPDDFAIVGEVLSVEPIACMLRKNDEAFKKAVNNSIQKQVQDGSLEELYNKWFMQPIAPTNTALMLPLSESTKNAWLNPNDKPMEEYK